MYRKFVIVLIIQLCCAAIGVSAFAQTPGSDTLKVTLNETEGRFLKNNLDLIVQRYHVSEAQAQVVTARLFSNPDFNISNVLYNPQSKRFFDMTHDGGEYTAQLSQLIQTAGKRNKNIQLAKISVEQAQFQLYDLLRTLKYTLRSDFYKIYYQEQSAKVYNEEITSLSSTLKAFKEQYAKGNISEKEVLRIQSQLYSLQVEYNDLKDAIDDTQSELKLIIKAPATSYLQPVVNYIPANQTLVANVPYQRLIDSAYTNRSDLKLAKSAVDYSNVNLQLQKAIAVPDITLQLGFDKQGSFVRNYNSAGIDFSLPFFNRNQGNIKQARLAIDESKVQLESQQDQVQSDVANSYKSALRLEQLYNSFDPKFKGDFDHLIGEVFKNYKKHNISLLEFLDFYDSYKTNTLQFNNIQLNRATSLEQLNYVTGSQIFNQ
ncbi:TolC family protein [Mucilaginibacter sp. KACC 22063]|uniref:TolC family protein n=1 Tax=Mucilaginibacter sp. KACC 22063 TaxID=3025666 RepID=UPI00236600C9|nr:TolC family protein [Mucilaginibacter sp. KACC 22063]WDF54431.1 TolC family protein [Mucilaginibacter sp. KACC 22063]